MSTGVISISLWIDRKQIIPDSGSPRTTFPVISAASNQPVHYALNATIDDVNAATASSGRAFQSWKRTPPQVRKAIIEKTAEIIERDSEEFVRLNKLECSATDMWARHGLGIVKTYLKEIAMQTSNIHGTIPMNENPDAMSFVFKQPVGPVLCIPPWNAALVLSVRAMAMAIAAGCTVVLKASELCPATHQKIVETFAEAGLPPGVLNSLQCRREDAPAITEALIADKNIRKVEFIGSANIGRIIGATAAKYLKPVLMELGGKCPAIVLEDANLEQAAKFVAMGALFNHGQICFSTERVFVQASISEKFKKILAEAFKNAASPDEMAVSKGIAQHAVDVLEDAKAKGAEFLIGGTDFGQVPSLKPAIILEPKKDMRIFDEETFGPSVSLYTFQTDEEVIAKANDSMYGLNAVIHTKNLERGLLMAKELEYGQVHFNIMSVYVSPFGPQGGVKGSGWGRQNAIWGLDQFLQTKFCSWRI
ncbi:aldehyde dehydrogenase [Rhizodiscina lignyota]|uniref:Aldehyde dehydrogenase n=1 Tax=Rhizodiscina lignyota TaxID=1504668 RepID=A0A9P4M8G0_9PEZI|nr:aldehyde dehydrogenase [Rhizodiscina lignyota]